MGYRRTRTEMELNGLGLLLERRRRELRLSKTDLVKRTDIHWQTYDYILRQGIAPSPNVLKRLAKALELPPEDLSYQITCQRRECGEPIEHRWARWCRRHRVAMDIY